MGAGKPYFTAKSHIQTLETERLGGRNKKASIQNGRNLFLFFFPFSRKKAKAEALQLVQGENQGQQGSNSDHSWEKDQCLQLGFNLPSWITISILLQHGLFAFFRVL